MRLRVLDKFNEYFSYINVFTILYGDVSLLLFFFCVLCGVHLSVTKNLLEMFHYLS